MPRIPKGNFDDTPNMNVQATKVPQVEAFGTQTLKQMGGQALEISTQWSKVQNKVQALTGVNKAETDAQNLEESVTNLKNNATNGVVKSSAFGDTEVPLADAVGQEIEKLRIRHMSEMKDNPDQIEMYNQFVMPRLQKMQNEAIRDQVAQQRDGTKTMLSDRMMAINMKNIQGEDISEDVYAFNVMAEKSKGILSQEEVSAHSKQLNVTVAMGLSKRLTQQGWSEQGEADARRKLASLPLSEGEKAVAEFKLNNSIEGAQEVTRRRTDQEFGSFIKDIADPKMYMAQKQKAGDILNNYNTLPLAPYETQEQRNNKVNELASSMITNELLVKYEGKVGRLTEEQVQSDILQIRSRVLNEEGRSPSSSEGIDKAIQTKVYAAIEKSRSKGGAFDTYESFTPHAMDMSNPNPKVREEALDTLDAYYNENNVPLNNRTYVSEDEIEFYGKQAAELAKGDSDPDGRHSLQLVRDFQNKYGSKTNKALDDVISLAGGTKAGSTKVPASWAVVPYIEDDGFASQLLSAQNRMDENIQSIGGDTRGLKKNVDIAIKDKSQVAKLRNGYLSDNDTIANGYADSLRALTYANMANNMGASEAVEQAEKQLSRYLTFGDSNKGSVMIPTHKLKANGYTSDDLSDAVEFSTDFNNFEHLGVNIAWDRMGKGEGSGLRQQFQAIAKAKPEERLAEAQKQLGSSLMIVNDGKKAENANLYLKVPNGAPVPLLIQGDEGVGKSNVNMLDMIKKQKEYEALTAKQNYSRRNADRSSPWSR